MRRLGTAVRGLVMLTAGAIHAAEIGFIAKLHYFNSRSVQAMENYGQRSVRVDDARDPLPKAYIQVYARMSDGFVQFYKDGYTDLRGRFEYATTNSNNLDSVTRFALLVMSDEHGAMFTRPLRQSGKPQSI